MKKGLTALLFFVMWFALFPQTGQAAAGGTSIYLDGNKLELSKNGQVQNINGSVMIPIRVVVEELGYVVDWEKKTRTVTIQQQDTVMKLVVDQSTALVNGTKIQMPVASKLVSDTVIVPLRFLGEQMGLSVSWDNQLKTVYLVTPAGGNGGETSPGDGGDGDTGTPPGDTDSGTQPGQTDNLANVGGISFSDNRLMIAVDQNVTPNIFTMANPQRVVIDLPNTKFADTFSSGYYLDSTQNGFIDITEYPEVSKVRYSLYSNNPSTVRIVLDMNVVKMGELINENDGLIILDLNKEVSNPGSNGKKLVVIDAGHGGKDPGAISVTGKKEKDFNLAVTLKVQELLKKETNIDFVLTRSSDTYPSLSDRVKIANDLNADLFISIHANAGSATASGVETYYTRSESLALAKVMHKYLVASSGLTDRGVRSKSLHVTRETKMPAVLLECGYLSNKSDNAKLYTEDFQDRVAAGIVKGIKEYLGLQ